MSNISCLTAQLTATLDKSMLVFCNRPFPFQTFLSTLSQMHVEVCSESVSHIARLLCSSEIFYNQVD